MALPSGMAQTAGAMFSGLGGNPTQALAGLGASYQSSYQNALSQNQQRYGQIMSGYGNMLNAQKSGAANVLKGYRDLQGQVLGGLEGVEKSRLGEINDYYTAQGGTALSRLAGKMMGNSGVRQSALRGLMADQTKAETSLAAQMAEMRAGYQSQFGMAAQGFRQQNLQDTQGLRHNRLGFLNSIQSPYPDAGAYMQLASMYGNQAQAEQDRADMMRLYEQQNALAGGAGVMPGSPGPAGLGYNPRPAPGYSSPDFGGGGMPSSGANLGFFNPRASGGYDGGGFYGSMAPQGSLTNPYPQIAQAPAPHSPGSAMGAVGGGYGSYLGSDYGGAADPNLMASGASLLQAMPNMGMQAVGGDFAGLLTSLAGLY